MGKNNISGIAYYTIGYSSYYKKKCLGASFISLLLSKIFIHELKVLRDGMPLNCRAHKHVWHLKSHIKYHTDNNYTFLEDIPYNHTKLYYY